jgi:hypothetical protein
MKTSLRRAKLTTSRRSQVGDVAVGIGRIAEDDGDRLGDGMMDRPLQRVEELRAGLSRDMPDRAASHRKPEGMDGVAGLGTSTTSPGAVIACAMLAKPSLEPSVATTSRSGSSFTPKRRP